MTLLVLVASYCWHYSSGDWEEYSAYLIFVILLVSFIRNMTIFSCIVCFNSVMGIALVTTLYDV